MIRWLMIGSFACLLVGTTGCLHHNTRCNSGSCGTSSCQTGSCNTCSTGDCNSGACSKMAGLAGLSSKGSGCRNGCVPGSLGWQQGGHDYSSHLNPGLAGHRSGQALQGRGYTAGAPTAQAAYPYYTVRGPRDFLVDNPPTIGR